ncbi:MAG: hypothetical protein AB4368_19255 [Xenococcaceae cyanobacterium]
MKSENQRDINTHQQKFLNQLEQLASQAASAQAEIASDAAKHEFRVRFNHYLQEKMALAAQETYSEVLHEVQEFINQFALATSARALDLESSTAKQIGEFKPATPQFASFSETLAQQRSQQSDLLKLNDVQLNSDSDKQALRSLGVSSEDNLDAKQIEANFVAINENNNHNGNGVTSE